MKLSLGLFLGAFVASSSGYSPTESDVKRDALFNKCSAEYKFVAEAAKRHSARSPENMDKCAETCSAKLRDASYKSYLNCFTCCDAFYGRTPESERAMEVGPTQIAAVNLPGFRGVRCETVPLAHPLKSNVNPENLVPFVSATHRNWGMKSGSGTHDAVIAWTQWLTHKAVRVCAAESGRHDNHHDNLVRLEVLVAERGVTSRSQLGEVSTGPISGTWCKDVKFENAFDKTPVVIVNPVHRHYVGNSNHEAMVHWVKGSSAEGFTVCAKNRHGYGASHDKFSMAWMAVRSGVATSNGHYITGRTGVDWKKSPRQPHYCQDIAFGKQLSSTDRANVQFTVVSDFPVVAWAEGGTGQGNIVCIAPAGGFESQFRPSRVTVDYIATSAAPNVKGTVPLTCKGLTDGFHDLDLDDDDGTVSQRMYCQGQKLVLANFWNTEENDFPDKLSLVESGFRKTGNGKWETVPRNIDPASEVSQAMPPKFVLHLMNARGWKNIHVCFKGPNHELRECRQVWNNGPGNSAGGASINKYNKPAKGGGNYAAWVYARMIGMPFSSDKCYGVLSKSKGSLCQHRTGCVARHAGSRMWSGNQGPGFCEHASSNSEWNGVWHGWGYGMSMVPAETGVNEYRTPYGPNSNGNTGFVLYMDE